MEKQIKILDPFEVELHTYIWEPDNKKKPVGVVQIVHGASEHAGRYREFATYLASRGFVVIANDHRGHGKTSAEDHVFFGNNLGFHKVYEGVRTVRDYIEQHYPKLRVIMLGHSMGSFIGRYAILYDYRRYDKALFIGTGYFSPVKLSFAKIVARIIKLFKGPHYVSPFFNNHFMSGAPRSMQKNGIINHRIEWLTHDRDIIEAWQKDLACGRPFSIQAQLDLLNFIPEVQNKQLIKDSASSTGIYFISGELDALGGYGVGVKKLYQIYQECGYSNVKFTLLNNNRHEVLNEIDREHNHKLIAEWMLR